MVFNGNRVKWIISIFLLFIWNWSSFQSRCSKFRWRNAEEKSETFNDNLLLFESFFGGRYASIIFVSTWRHTYLKMKKKVWSKELIHMRVHRLAFISFCYVPNTWVGFKFWCLTFLCVLVSTMPRQNCATTYFKKVHKARYFLNKYITTEF